MQPTKYTLGLMLAGAAAYAAADKSDPFAYKRAVSHSLNGVASMNRTQGNHPDGTLIEYGPAHYNATSHTVTRTLPDGTKYPAIEYVNVVRP